MTLKAKKIFYLLNLSYFVLTLVLVSIFYVVLRIDAKNTPENSAGIAVLIGVVGLILFGIPVFIPSTFGAVCCLVRLSRLNRKTTAAGLILLSVFTFIPVASGIALAIAFSSVPFALPSVFGFALFVSQLVLFNKLRT